MLSIVSSAHCCFFRYAELENTNNTQKFHWYQKHNWTVVSNGRTIAWTISFGLEMNNDLNCLLRFVNCTRNTNVTSVTPLQLQACSPLNL